MRHPTKMTRSFGPAILSHGDLVEILELDGTDTESRATVASGPTATVDRTGFNGQYGDGGWSAAALALPGVAAFPDRDGRDDESGQRVGP